eukprot:3893113-Rhodomonas_salina.1
MGCPNQKQNCARVVQSVLQTSLISRSVSGTGVVGAGQSMRALRHGRYWRSIALVCGYAHATPCPGPGVRADATHVGVLNKGSLVEFGRPAELQVRPRTRTQAERERETERQRDRETERVYHARETDAHTYAERESKRERREREA